MEREQFLSDVGVAVQEVAPFDASGLEDLARTCLDSQPDPETVGAALAKMGVGADALDGEMKRLESRRAAADVFADLPTRQEAVKEAAVALADAEARFKEIERRELETHQQEMKRLRAAKEEAQKALDEAVASRKRLVDSARPGQHKARYEAGQRRLLASRKVGYAKDALGEAEAQAKNLQADLDRGPTRGCPDPAEWKRRTTENLVRAEAAVKRQQAELVAAEEEHEQADQDCKEALGRMLQP